MAGLNIDIVFRLWPHSYGACHPISNPDIPAWMSQSLFIINIGYTVDDEINDRNCMYCDGVQFHLICYTEVLLLNYDHPMIDTTKFMNRE